MRHGHAVKHAPPLFKLATVSPLTAVLRPRRSALDSRLFSHPLRQPGHYLFIVPAAAAALVLWQATPGSDVGRSSQVVLPWLLASLGCGLALAYHRMRALCLLLLVVTAFSLLHSEVGSWLRSGRIDPLTPLRFHALSAWLPLLFALHALWPERGRTRRELLLRATVTSAGPALFVLLAAQSPEAMHDLLSNRHWGWLPAHWSRLAQLPTLLFVLASLALGWQAWTRPRPLHSAMLLGLLALWWMLPRVFLQPALLPALSSAALLLVIAAVLQEGFHMAFRDELTGLPGRRAFNEYVQRAGAQYSIAMVDVDHFKTFNDTHGHDTGDDVLRLVAARLAGVTEGGRAFRYGGEEFALVFLDRSAADCLEAVAAVREHIAGSRMQLRDRSTRSRDDATGRQQRGTGGRGPVVQVTVSIGLADSDVGPARQVIKAADQALYVAKDDGRNCVRCHRGASVAATRTGA